MTPGFFYGNRDGAVIATDVAIARQNAGRSLPVISTPAPAAPRNAAIERRRDRPASRDVLT